MGLTKNITKGIFIGFTIAIIWFFLSVFLTTSLQNKQINYSGLTLAFWLTAFSISIFVEEIAFRAFLLQSFKKHGAYFALIASSIAFVVILYPGWILFNMMPDVTIFISASFSIFILGLVLGIVFFRTKSIWAVLIIHAFNNLAATLMISK